MFTLDEVAFIQNLVFYIEDTYRIAVSFLDQRESIFSREPNPSLQCLFAVTTK